MALAERAIIATATATAAAEVEAEAKAKVEVGVEVEAEATADSCCSGLSLSQWCVLPTSGMGLINN